MKKVIVTAALVLGGFSTYAIAPQVLSTAPTEKIVTETFKEIPLEKLPEAVTTVFKADFKTATLNKAYVNEKQEYKLDFTIDGAASTVYADKDGNWIEKKQ